MFPSYKVNAIIFIEGNIFVISIEYNMKELYVTISMILSVDYNIYKNYNLCIWKK